MKKILITTNPFTFADEADKFIAALRKRYNDWTFSMEFDAYAANNSIRVYAYMSTEPRELDRDDRNELACIHEFYCGFMAAR